MRFAVSQGRRDKPDWLSLVVAGTLTSLRVGRNGSMTIVTGPVEGADSAEYMYLKTRMRRPGQRWREAALSTGAFKEVTGDGRCAEACCELLHRRAVHEFERDEGVLLTVEQARMMITNMPRLLQSEKYNKWIGHFEGRVSKLWLAVHLRSVGNRHGYCLKGKDDSADIQELTDALLPLCRLTSLHRSIMTTLHKRNNIVRVSSPQGVKPIRLRCPTAAVDPFDGDHSYTVVKRSKKTPATSEQKRKSRKKLTAEIDELCKKADTSLQKLLASPPAQARSNNDTILTPPTLFPNTFTLSTSPGSPNLPLSPHLALSKDTASTATETPTLFAEGDYSGPSSMDTWEFTPASVCSEESHVDKSSFTPSPVQWDSPVEWELPIDEESMEAETPTSVGHNDGLSAREPLPEVSAFQKYNAAFEAHLWESATTYVPLPGQKYWLAEQPRAFLNDDDIICLRDEDQINIRLDS